MSGQNQDNEAPAAPVMPPTPYHPPSTIALVVANPGTLTVNQWVTSTRQGAHRGCRRCQKLWQVVPIPGNGEPYLVSLPGWALPPRRDVHGWWFCAPQEPKRGRRGFYLEHHFPPDTVELTRRTHLNRCGALQWRRHATWDDLERSCLSWRLHNLAVPFGTGRVPLYKPPVFPDLPQAVAMARSASAPVAVAGPASAPVAMARSASAPVTMAGSTSAPVATAGSASAPVARTRSVSAPVPVSAQLAPAPQAQGPQTQSLPSSPAGTRKSVLVVTSEGWCPKCKAITHVGSKCPRNDRGYQ